MGENIALLYMSAYFAQPAPEGSKNRFLRTQTNEAAVSALWKDPASRPDKKDTGLLPLSTSAIEQTLGDVAFYLFKLKECKATAPVGIELLDSNKAF